MNDPRTLTENPMHTLLLGLLCSLAVCMGAGAQEEAPASEPAQPVIELSQPAPETPQSAGVPAAPAQEDDFWAEFADGADSPVGVHLLFGVGYQRAALGPLQSQMTQRGYGNLPEDLLSLGGHLQLSLWNVLTEFEGNVASTWPQVNEDYSVTMSNAQFLFNVGYQFRPTPSVSIYPLVGLGMNLLDLNFTRRTISPSFDDVLAAPTRQGQLTHTAFALNVGLGADWHWGWLGKIGIRGGMLFTPFAGVWSTSSAATHGSSSSINDIPVAGGPDVRAGGPYLRVMVGF